MKIEFDTNELNIEFQKFCPFKIVSHNQLAYEKPKHPDDFGHNPFFEEGGTPTGDRVNYGQLVELKNDRKLKIKGDS